MLMRVVICWAILTVSAFGDVLYVDVAANCPGEGTEEAPFCRIQSAIQAASEGDVVLVGPGLYFEKLRINKRIEVRSVAGPEETTLHGQGVSGTLVTFGPLADRRTVLEGFRFRDSYTHNEPSCIECEDSASPTIRDCLFASNAGYSSVATISSVSGAPLIESCVMRNNAYGISFQYAVDAEIRDCQILSSGGVSVYRGCATIRNTTITQTGGTYGAALWASLASDLTVDQCEVVDNEGAGIQSEDFCNVAVIGSTIARNRRGGIHTAFYDSMTIINSTIVDNEDYTVPGVSVHYYSDLRIVNSTIARNRGIVTDRSAGLSVTYSSTADVINSILWGNTVREVHNDRSQVNVSFSDVLGGYAGAGNVDLDPLFLDPENLDYRLGCQSPLIDLGTDSVGVPLPAFDRSGQNLRRIGSGIDLGADEVGTRWTAGVAQPGSNLMFMATASPGQLGEVSQVFLSRAESDGLRVPGAGGRVLKLAADPLLSVWLSLPASTREVTLTGCEEGSTLPIVVPPNTTGFQVYYAGVTWDLAAGEVTSISDPRSFTIN